MKNKVDAGVCGGGPQMQRPPSPFHCPPAPSQPVSETNQTQRLALLSYSRRLFIPLRLSLFVLKQRKSHPPISDALDPPDSSSVPLFLLLSGELATDGNMSWVDVTLNAEKARESRSACFFL